MDAANLMEGEKVQIVNNNNGERFETYVIRGQKGSGVIGINGAAAHLVKPGDLVIIAAYGWMKEKAARKMKRSPASEAPRASRQADGSGARHTAWALRDPRRTAPNVHAVELLAREARTDRPRPPAAASFA